MSERFRDDWAFRRPANVVPIAPRRAPEVSDDELNEIPISRLLRDPPERDWMVKNMFLRSTVGALYGEGGKGKSLLFQQLASCAPLGLDWLGLPVKRGKSLYLACEDDIDECHRRQKDINRSLGIAMEDLWDAGYQIHSRVDRRSNALMRLDKPSWRMANTQLMHNLVKRCREQGIQYLLIDTATKTFRGNQNDEAQVDDFISELRQIAIMMQGVVLFTKHPSVTGRTNGTGEGGSVAWSNGVRGRLYLHAPDKDKTLYLERMKGNYTSPEAFRLPLVWERGVFRVNEPEPPYWGKD